MPVALEALAYVGNTYSVPWRETKPVLVMKVIA